MIGFSKEKELYMQIQEHLFDMIPEGWKNIYLHVSIIDIPNQIPKGELYIYYIPKGILKRKPVNCFEIPDLFDIDQEEYSRLMTSLFNVIKLLRMEYRKYKGNNFTTLDIICSNKVFNIKYGFEDIVNSEYSRTRKTFNLEI